MSESDSSGVLRDIAQQLGLSQFSASLIDLESISDGSSDLSSISSGFANTSHLQNPNDLSLAKYSHNMRSLETQLNQRDLVIDSIRQQHREQLDALHQKLRETDSAINFIKQKFEEKVNAMNQRFAEEKQAIQRAADAEVKRLKDLNRAHRQNLAFDRLPELTPEEYESISSRPATDITLTQFLAAQLYEFKNKHTKGLSRAEKERDTLAAANQKLQTQLNNANAELVTERELRISLESRLAASTKRLPPKAATMDAPDMSEKLRKIEDERAELRGAYQVALSRLNEANEAKTGAQRKGSELEAELTQAKAEITSLRAQLQAMQTLTDKQEAIMNQQFADIAELKRTRDDFFNKLVQSSESRRSEFGQLLKNEVERMSERSRNDVEYIRDVTEKMREREFKILSQSHESAVGENKQLRLDLRKAEEERAKLQAEYQTLQLAHEAELTRISSDLRVKSYELERIKLVYDELKAQHEDLGDDRDALAAKFDIVKQEVMKLEHDVKLRDSQIQSLSDKVNMYEKLENELDMAIETLDLNSVGPLAVPSDANRRVKQSIMLAKRVMQLTQTNNQLTAECESLKQQLVNYTEEMNEMKKNLEASGKPQQVFVEMLNQKQQEIGALKAKLASLQEVNQELVREKESLQQDVRLAAHTRNEVNQAKRFAGCFLASADDEPTRDCVDPAPFVITRKE